MATKPPVHDEAMLLLESMLLRALVEPSAVLSSVMAWRPMQRTVLSNAALRCVAAMFMRGTLLLLHKWLLMPCILIYLLGWSIATQPAC